jgi:hypothetical protein
VTWEGVVRKGILGLVWLGLVASACRGDGVPAVSMSSAPSVSAASSVRSAPAPRPALPPRVTLAGAFAPSPADPSAGAPRIYGRAMRAWIYAEPSKKSQRLGYLRAGASTITTPEPVSQADCRGGWHPVAPEGYVCAGKRATLDRNDAVVRATIDRQPDVSRKLPYVYGTVRRPGPIYGRLPAGDELGQTEPDLEERMTQWLDAEGEIGAGYAQDVWLGGEGSLVEPRLAWKERTSDPLPWFLEKGGSAPSMLRRQETGLLVIERMRPRVGHAFLRTFLHEGRRYGVSADLKILPTDRLRPIRGSEFHGVEIGDSVKFPFAFVRRADARFWLYQRSSNSLIDAGTAPFRSAVSLTGKQQFFKSRLHYETTDGKWLSDRDASRLDPARRMPAWGKNGEKWIDVNLTKQTMVLYEGTKAVYATLISSGEAGLEDHKHSTATKRGIFRIHTKHLTSTMSSDEVGEEFELRDVPYVQYFDEGYAMHGAYWHDRFGTPKSHGCINLSPEDARRLFFWTEPQLPAGWHGVLLPLKGTVMFVHP